MHILRRTFVIAACATFSTSVQADDVASHIEENFPYKEVSESYGKSKIHEGQCQEGTPFLVVHDRFQVNGTMNLAARIHEKVRSLGANAMAMTELDGSRIIVTPLTCNLNEAA